MPKTKIEWTNETWNPVTGCSKTSPGCKNCYAEAIAKRFWGDRKFTDVHLHSERLEQPLHWREPRMVFVNSMSDLFHEDVPFEFIDKVFAVAVLTPWHIYQILTKRIEMAKKYFDSEPELRIYRKAEKMLQIPWVNDKLKSHFNEEILDEKRWSLPNVWLGVSCENQETADERIPLLLQTPAAVRFVSLEPLLGPIILQSENPESDCRYLGRFVCHECEDEPPTKVCNCCIMTTEVTKIENGLDWVIVGGESGVGARPCNIEWIRDVVRQCKETDTPVFVKQVGSNPMITDVIRTATKIRYKRGRLKSRKGGDPSEWPEDLRVREFPKQVKVERKG